MNISGLGYRNQYQNNGVGKRQGHNVQFQSFMEQHTEEVKSEAYGKSSSTDIIYAMYGRKSVNNVNISKASEAAGISDNKSTNYEKTVSASYTKVSGENHYTDPNNGKTVYSGYNGYTFYTKEGIFYMQSGCDTKSMEYRDTVEWTVKFNSDEDYEKAMEFLSKFPEGDSKKFAANEQFWNDFVGGKIDEEDFMKFYDTLDHGIARCVKTDENGNDRIDMEMARSKYFDYFSGADFKPVSYEEVVRKFFEGSRAGESAEEKSPLNVLSNFFKDTGKRMFDFANEEMQYSLQDWISEIVNRARGGLLAQLAAK